MTDFNLRILCKKAHLKNMVKECIFRKLCMLELTNFDVSVRPQEDSDCLNWFLQETVDARYKFRSATLTNLVLYVSHFLSEYNRSEDKIPYGVTIYWWLSFENFQLFLGAGAFFNCTKEGLANQTNYYRRNSFSNNAFFEVCKVLLRKKESNFHILQSHETNSIQQGLFYWRLSES